MSMINKVPASAGAQWLLDGLATLRQAPLQLGALGALWALLMGFMLVLSQVPVFGTLLQAFFMLVGPVLWAGVLGAVLKVRAAQPIRAGDLFSGFRSGRIPDLIATLIPQVVLIAVMFLLVWALVGGPEELQRVQDTMNKLESQAAAGQTPSPELLQTVPVAELFICFGAFILGMVLVALVNFVSVPDVLFGGRRGTQAMLNSLKAGLRNLPAVILFYVLLLVVAIPLILVVSLLGQAVSMVLGQFAGLFFINMLLMGAMLPLIAGCVSSAWRQMLGQASEQASAGSPPPSPPATFAA